MGAWDLGAFDNDSALDWIDGADGDPVAIDAALAAAHGLEYVEEPEGSAVVAAATIVAAAIAGQSEEELPPAAEALAATLVVDEALRSRAVAALDVVLGDNSELRQLHDEARTSAQWRSSIERLRTRIAGS
jgi:hypothetical protein